MERRPVTNMISYAVTVCNESRELERLLCLLKAHLREGDEVVVQADATNVTEEVRQVVKRYAYTINCYVEYPLNFDFARFKNHLNEQCTGEYIFQLDADEMPSEWLLDHLRDIVRKYRWVGLFKLPRINLFDESEERVSWPDYQGRIYKNRPGRIRWHRPLHERIRGHWLYWHLPKDDKYALLHHKQKKADTAKWQEWKRQKEEQSQQTEQAAE